MALFDVMYEFLDDQTLTTTNGTTIGATCKTVDWQASDLEMGAGEPIWVNIQVGTVAITGGTSVDFRLLADAVEGGQDSGSLVVLSVTHAEAALGIGEWILRAPLPVNVDDRRYLAVAMYSATTPTGKINAWLDHGPQSSYDTQVSTSNI